MKNIVRTTWLMAAVLLVFTAFGAQAQGSVNAKPSKQMTRAQLLALGDKAVELLPTVEITDLVTLQQAPKVADQKFYMYPSDFRKAPADKQLHMLGNAAQYVVIPEGSAKPKTPISRQELSRMSPEKRAEIEKSPLFEIVD